MVCEQLDVQSRPATSRTMSLNCSIIQILRFRQYIRGESIEASTWNAFRRYAVQLCVITF